MTIKLRPKVRGNDINEFEEAHTAARSEQPHPSLALTYVFCLIAWFLGLPKTRAKPTPRSYYSTAQRDMGGRIGSCFFTKQTTNVH